MNKIEKYHFQENSPTHNMMQGDNSPYWKRAHRDWRFVVGMFLIVLAIIYHIASSDVALQASSIYKKFPQAEKEGDSLSSSFAESNPFANKEANASGSNFEINVFPNPSTGTFTVELNAENSEKRNIDLVLVSSTGQEIFHKNAAFLNGNELIELAEGIASGVYVLRARNDEQEATKRILLKR